MAEFSQTGDQMLTVLETVAAHGPISAAETARICDLNRTVVHRLLATLARRAYVRRDGRGYQVGPAVVSLTRSFESDIVTLSRPWMEKLAASVGETVVLHGFDNGEAVVLHQAPGQKHLVRVQHTPGSRHPLFLGASGWSILAYLDPKTQIRVARRADNAASVAARIEQIRSLGYAISNDELQMGVHGVAVPLLRPDGACCASIGILVPAVRSDSLNRLIEPLQATAKTINQSLTLLK